MNPYIPISAIFSSALITFFLVFIFNSPFLFDIMRVIVKVYHLSALVLLDGAFFKLNICIFTLVAILLFVIKIIKSNFNLTKNLKYSVTISFVISCGLYFDLTEFIAISSFVTFGISICKFMFRDQDCEVTNSNQSDKQSEK